MKDFGKGRALLGFSILQEKVKNRYASHPQMLLAMRLTIILLTVALTHVQASVFSQNITLSGRDLPLKTIFNELETQTGYTFFYKNELLKNALPVTIDVKNGSLEQVLRICFAGQPLSYNIQNKTIFVIARKEPAHPVAADTAKPQDNSQTAGTILLHGRVVDKNGDGLPGVSVSLRGTKFAWLTKPDGTFTGVLLENNIGDHRILVFTSVGYSAKLQAFPASGKFMLIVLQESSNTLDEVQTTAYSKTSLRFNTGDITTITADEIARNPVNNVLDALQGRVAGMQVTSLSGETNGAYSVQIRSVNTLAGGTTATPQLLFNDVTGQPMYIVDGVEFPANGRVPMIGQVGGSNNTLEGGNALNYLDPSQIESINVLKGADATAIYGSRGAFGVILITTKKAKTGKPTVFVSAQQGFSEVGPTPKLLDNQQYLAMRHDAFTNASATPGPGDYDVNGTWDSTKGTNWQKNFINSHAPMTRAATGYSGGTDQSNFLVGANFTSTGNVQQDRGSVQDGSINFSMHTTTLNRKFSLALSGSYEVNVDDRVPVDFTDPNFLDQAPDAQLPYLPNGQLNWANGYNQSAVLNTIYKNSTDNLLSNMTMTYTPIKGLSFIAAGGVSLISAKELLGSPSSVFNPLTFVASDRNSTLNTYSIRTISADPRVEYAHTFWKKGVLDVIAGGSIRDKSTQQEAIEGSGFLNDELLLDPASAQQSNLATLYTIAPDRYTGIFTQIKYRWADKYILDLNGRRDGSSLFGNNKQFGNFGSVAGGWIISEEPWFKNLRPAIDFLKLKGSYGLVGGNSLSPFQYLSIYQVTGNSYEGGNGLSPYNLTNPYLHWETDKNAEGGVNIDLFKGRVNLETIYYSDHVSDQLGPQALASITGFTSVEVNLPATIHTYGWEITASTHNIRTKNFTWDTKLNFTAPRSKLVSYPGLNTLVGNANWIIGKPITGVKLYRYAGVNPATGAYSFYDSAGVKGEYTPILSPAQLNPISDKTGFANLAPVWYGGITNSFTYKNLSMDFLVYVADKVGPNYLGFQTFPLGQFNTNWPKDLAARRWMKPGDKTNVPAATTNFISYLDQTNFIASTGAYTNATYARLQNLSISYHFPARIVHRVSASQITVFAAGQNLLTISKYGDLDPENMSAGHMPPLRVFTGGFNVTF
jgi:TonB-dependent starch-binding outer membrane protein SusC